MLQVYTFIYKLHTSCFIKYSNCHTPATYDCTATTTPKDAHFNFDSPVLHSSLFGHRLMLDHVRRLHANWVSRKVTITRGHQTVHKTEINTTNRISQQQNKHKVEHTSNSSYSLLSVRINKLPVQGVERYLEQLFRVEGTSVTVTLNGRKPADLKLWLHERKKSTRGGEKPISLKGI